MFGEKMVFLEFGVGKCLTGGCDLNFKVSSPHLVVNSISSSQVRHVYNKNKMVFFGYIRKDAY